MKLNKIVYSISLAILFLIACNNSYDITSDLKNKCQEIKSKTSLSRENFESVKKTDEKYSSLCKLYKDNLKKQIEICDKEDNALQIILNNLNCSSSCANAYKIVLKLKEKFENSPSKENCKQLREALLNQKNICGDPTGEIQNLIEDTICEENILGSWKKTSLTINGIESLQNEIDQYKGCYLTFQFTETFFRQRVFWGQNCDSIGNFIKILYTKKRNHLVFYNHTKSKMDSFKITELTDKTLKLKFIDGIGEKRITSFIKN